MIKITGKTIGKFYGIVGKKKTDKKFMPFDYSRGVFVGNVIYSTLWDNKPEVERLVKHANENNPDYEFKLIERGN